VKPRKSMGIDLSTKTGVAVVDSNKKLLLATEFEFEKFTGNARLQLIAGHLLDLIAQHEPDNIVIEGQIHGAKFVSAVQQDIAAVARYVLYENDHPYYDVSPSTLKKFLTGKGTAKKELMMMEVLHQWGWKSSTNNIADAIALAMFGQGILGMVLPTPKALVIKGYVKSIGKNT
jgi:Holliday junction resolvasome RuvABC endonuclease subunit